MVKFNCQNCVSILSFCRLLNCCCLDKSSGISVTQDSRGFWLEVVDLGPGPRHGVCPVMILIRHKPPIFGIRGSVLSRGKRD